MTTAANNQPEVDTSPLQGRGRINAEIKQVLDYIYEQIGIRLDPYDAEPKLRRKGGERFFYADLGERGGMHSQAQRQIESLAAAYGGEGLVKRIEPAGARRLAIYLKQPEQNQ